MSEIRLSGIVKSWVSDDRRFELSVPEFSIGAGEVVVLTGPNGTGKSTFLELLGLASRPDRGRIDVSQQDMVEVDVAALWQAGKLKALSALRAAICGYVLQSIHLLPFLSVRENVALAQKISGRGDEGLLQHLLQQLGLSDRENALPQTLSPGLRQRAAVARALAHRPKFILADEPTAALDPAGGDAVVALLVQLAREEGAAVILSTHRELPTDALGEVGHVRTRQVADTEPGTIRAVLERGAL